MLRFQGWYTRRSRFFGPCVCPNADRVANMRTGCPLVVCEAYPAFAALCSIGQSNRLNDQYIAIRSFLQLPGKEGSKAARPYWVIQESARRQADLPLPDQGCQGLACYGWGKTLFNCAFRHNSITTYTDLHRAGTSRRPHRLPLLVDTILFRTCLLLVSQSAGISGSSGSWGSQ